MQNLHFNGVICHGSENCIDVRRYISGTFGCVSHLFYLSSECKIACCWLWKLLKPPPCYKLHVCTRENYESLAFPPLLQFIYLCTNMHCVPLDSKLKINKVVLTYQCFWKKEDCSWIKSVTGPFREVLIPFAVWLLLT